MNEGYIDFNIQEELRKLPKKPGVYLMHGPSDEIIYIGKAVNLYQRVHQYFQSPEKKSPKIQKMITLIRRFEYIVVDSELEALVLENNLIKENRPKYNTLLKDDKTYPYIKVTLGEEYPRLLTTRKFRKDRSRYFGPYTSAAAVRECTELLHKLYQIRTCSRKLPEDAGKERPCLYYHLGQCSAPCSGNVTKEEYAKGVRSVLSFLEGKYEAVGEELKRKMLFFSEQLEFEKAAEYRDLMKSVEELMVRQKVTAADLDHRDVIGFARGASDAVAMVFFIRSGKMVGREHFHMEADASETEPELLQAFLSRYYTGTPFVPGEILLKCEIPDQKLTEEWLTSISGHKCVLTVPKKGEKDGLVALATQNAEIVLHQDSEKIRKEELRTKGALREIRELLGLASLHRVESFDISNTNGFESVGSMVVFHDGVPKKHDYRKFRIKTVAGPDDYASMREMLHRRYSHENDAAGFGAYPELILMDGGKGQVNLAEEVIREFGLSIPVAGLVKDDRHRTRGIIFRNRELPLSAASEGFQLLTRIQDETHRFAIEYHRSLRSEKQVHSVLDDIPGIGPKRRRALMRAFSSLEELKKAGEEELAAIETMDRKSAESVYRYFHP